MLTSLFSLFYVIGEFHRFLHRGRAGTFAICYGSGERPKNLLMNNWFTV